MAGTLLYGLGLNYGSNFYPWIYKDQGRIIPCIIGDETPVPHERRKQFRVRPTGESGSGPYFVSYLNPSSGEHWYNATSGNDQLVTSLDVVEYDCNGGVGSQVHFYTNGVEAFSCGVGGGAYTGRVGWNYIIRKDDGYYVDRRGSYVPSSGRVYTWQEAEELMMDNLNPIKYRPDNLVRYDNCYYRSAQYTQSFDWKLSELDAFLWHDLTGVLPRGYQVAATQSYIAAAEALPQATTNSIMNVLQSAASVVSLLHGDFSPKSIKDVWLRYRYEYCTTKMDVEEYASLTRRLMVLANASKVNCKGSFEYKGVSCVTSFDVDSSQWLPKDTASWLRAYGFRFSAVNAWDMIPYSFVVDWFLHIGDLLQAFQKQGDAISLQVTDCWHTFQTEYDNQFTMLRVPKAIRWSVPYVSYQPASSKTIGKRITDAIALFLC